MLYPCTKLHLYVSLINRLCFLPSLSIGTKCTSVCTSPDVSASDYTSCDPPHAWAIGGVQVLCLWGVTQMGVKFALPQLDGLYH